MEQDVNILMEQYKQALINVTQNSQLPIGVVRYIFNDVNNMINREYETYLQDIMMARRKQEEAQQQQEEPAAVEGEVE